MYIPPNSDRKYISDLIDYLTSLLDVENLILLGDLHLPDVNWDSLDGELYVSSSLCEIFFDLNLTQMVTGPTHNKGNLLDVILTNAMELIEGVSVSPASSHDLSSDHCLVKFYINNTINSKSASSNYSTAFNFAKCDWNTMLTFLSSYDFTLFYSSHDIEFLWSCLKQAILVATQFSTPRISRRSHERPQWFTSDLKHQLNCIHSLRRRQSKNPSPNLKDKLASTELNL